ncbi:hypothetical protein H671_2g4366 [Cricetulus griseus]|nr:hypothetical protein H671_2g4366 [Cricetulus griseus]
MPPPRGVGAVSGSPESTGQTLPARGAAPTRGRATRGSSRWTCGGVERSGRHRNQRSKVKPVMSGKTWQREPEAADHIASAVRKQRAMDSVVQICDINDDDSDNDDDNLSHSLEYKLHEDRFLVAYSADIVPVVGWTVANESDPSLYQIRSKKLSWELYIEGNSFYGKSYYVDEPVEPQRGEHFSQGHMTEPYVLGFVEIQMFEEQGFYYSNRKKMRTISHIAVQINPKLFKSVVLCGDVSYPKYNNFIPGFRLPNSNLEEVTGYINVQNLLAALRFVYMVDYIDGFSYVEPSLHPWDEAYLIMMNDFSDMFLDLIRQYFIEYFSIVVHEGYRPSPGLVLQSMVLAPVRTHELRHTNHLKGLYWVLTPFSEVHAMEGWNDEHMTRYLFTSLLSPASFVRASFLCSAHWLISTAWQDVCELLSR